MASRSMSVYHSDLMVFRLLSGGPSMRELLLRSKISSTEILNFVEGARYND